ncbi:hypothetical protein CYMTET_48190 [Cymbomonas tetramitiformis]|uniref:DNA methylase N-4/N-6 domain-containing protein n=1 Tax=Cymbomonas tetramitiformis TaxID=36881 RepID=A0AAE0BU32_9CHLO|nr:hypothetical protein CYMTET_48190 [Cymbomonas tetramitiformis]
MPGFVKLDGNRMTEVKGNTPIASGHLYTTLARYLNKPKLDYKKQVELKSEKLKEETGITHLTNFYCGNVLGPFSIHEWDVAESLLEANMTNLIEEGKCNYTLSKALGMYTGKLWNEFVEYGKSFQALHSQKVFKHCCYTTGCVALDKICEANKETLVVGQKSIPLCEYLVGRYASALGQVVMDPFMGSGSCGVAAIRKGRCFYGFAQKQTNFFAALFHLSHAVQSYVDGTNEEEYSPP